MEKDYGVKQTWRKDEAQFQMALKRLTEKKQHRLLLSLQRMASERIFLLEL